MIRATKTVLKSLGVVACIAVSWFAAGYATGRNVAQREAIRRIEAIMDKTRPAKRALTDPNPVEVFNNIIWRGSEADVTGLFPADADLSRLVISLEPKFKGKVIASRRPTVTDNRDGTWTISFSAP